LSNYNGGYSLQSLKALGQRRQGNENQESIPA